MENFHDTLEHLAEPAAGERDDAQSIDLEAWEALWFQEFLLDFAHYEGSDPYRTVAFGLSEYIDKKVREQELTQVRLYLHTDVAVETVMSAWQYAISHTVSKTPQASVGEAIDEVTE